MGYNEERLLTKCCVKKRCGSEYVKHGIVYQRRFWKDFAIQCHGELQILLKQTEVKRNVGVQVCCCVFIGMYLSMLVCFHRKVFDVYIQMLSD